MEVIAISSESNALIKEELIKIIENEKNIITCDYLFNDMDYILEEASYLSLFDEKKFLIVKNANFFASEKLNEADTANLERYLENPNSNTSLIFTFNQKPDERKKITNIIKKNYQLQIIKKLTMNELIERINNFFKKNNKAIKRDTIIHIINAGLSNWDLIINELDKILLFYYDSNEIIHEDVIELVAKNIEDNIFKFTDAAIKKDIVKAFTLLEDLKSIKIEPIILLNNLAREYRLLYKTLVLLERGYNQKQITQTLGLVDWLAQKVLTNSNNYRKDVLKDKLSALADLDISMKRGVYSNYLGLEMFLLEI